MSAENPPPLCPKSTDIGLMCIKGLDFICPTEESIKERVDHIRACASCTLYLTFLVEKEKEPDGIIFDDQRVPERLKEALN